MRHLTDKPVLASTLHDPTGVFADTISHAAGLIGRHFDGWSVNVTGVTAEPVVTALRESGVNVTTANPLDRMSSSPIEDDHLCALKGAAEVADRVGSDAVAYTDGDRAILAALYYPDFFEEFASTAESVTGTRKGHVNIRRTPEDYLTHPYFDTEFEINRLCSKAFGGPVDVVSTTHMMDRGIVGQILDQSSSDEPLDFPHLKWLILAGKNGAQIFSREISGLPFETPYQVMDGDKTNYRGVLEAYNSQKLVDRGYKAAVVNPAEQELRHGTVVKYLTYLGNHLGDFDMTHDRRTELQSEIGMSIGSMERRQAASVEGLQRTGLWTPGARR